MAETVTYVKINSEKYGYDILALMKSFYPEKNLQLILPESNQKHQEESEAGELFASIDFSWEETTETIDSTEGMISANTESDADLSAEKTDPATITLQMKGQQDVFLTAENTYADFKEGMGAWLYGIFSKDSGRTLPWGTLNGVRPTKIAFHMQEEGKSDEEIRDFYQKRRLVSRKKADLSIEIARRERALLSSIDAKNGYSLYIGIPFCPTTCLYCSFTSFPIAVYRKQVDAYVDALLKELRFVAETMKDHPLDTVYMGGGTPTTLEAEQLDRLLGAVREWFDFSGVKEFTVEAGRADSITEAKLQVLRKHGVSRISVNPQTFHQETLDFIGRKATVAQTIEAYELARRVGFDNINMDLILGLPGESVDHVRTTMEEVKRLAPDSLTVHSLAIKRASKLNQWIKENGISMLNNTEESMAVTDLGARALGLEPYYLYRQKNMSGNFENVGYAAPGKFGIYNILIMEEVQTIVACGAGTVTKRVYSDGRIERCDNVKDVALYISKIEEMIDRKRELFKD